MSRAPSLPQEFDSSPSGADGVILAPTTAPRWVAFSEFRTIRCSRTLLAVRLGFAGAHHDVDGWEWDSIAPVRAFFQWLDLDLDVCPETLGKASVACKEWQIKYGRFVPAGFSAM